MLHFLSPLGRIIGNKCIANIIDDAIKWIFIGALNLLCRNFANIYEKTIDFVCNDIHITYDLTIISLIFLLNYVHSILSIIDFITCPDIFTLTYVPELSALWSNRFNIFIYLLWNGHTCILACFCWYKWFIFTVDLLNAEDKHSSFTWYLLI